MVKHKQIFRNKKSSYFRLDNILPEYFEPNENDTVGLSAASRDLNPDYAEIYMFLPF